MQAVLRQEDYRERRPPKLTHYKLDESLTSGLRALFAPIILERMRRILLIALLLAAPAVAFGDPPQVCFTPGQDCTG